jgi:probable addiction module antidote protein
MKPTFTPFDAADYLTDEETIAAYLNAAAENGDTELLLIALKDVANARSMTQLTKDSGLARASLYKALTREQNHSLKR